MSPSARRPAASSRPARPRPTTAPLALPDRPGWVRLAAGAAVPGVVAAVAALAALQVFVLNPLAAAPGDRGLGRIYADLSAAGQLGVPFVLSAVILAAGLGVAAILWFLTWRREEVDPLAVLALGLWALSAFDLAQASTVQLTDTHSWIPAIGASWALGVNGLGLVAAQDDVEGDGAHALGVHLVELTGVVDLVSRLEVAVHLLGAVARSQER